MADKEAIREAREWARQTIQQKDGRLYGEVAAAEAVLELSEEPSLENEEWDRKKHFLLGVTDDDGDNGVLVGSNGSGEFQVYYPLFNGVLTAFDSNLRPNGKKYQITEEDAAPEVAAAQPKTLTTKEDYENAPAGTVVALHLFAPWTKSHNGKWESGTSSVGSHDLSLSGPHTVLRWGW